MAIMVVNLLALPERLFPTVERGALSLGGTAAIVDRSAHGGCHVAFTVESALEPVARLYDAVHATLRPATDLRRDSLAAIKAVRYRADPACMIPMCSAPPCTQLCGGDLWSTALYWRGLTNPVGDCDDIELYIAGLGAGCPLFILPKGETQGHVIHLIEPYGNEAIDYCIPAGMAIWTGERQCFFIHNGRRVSGSIVSLPNQRNRFQCQW